jgi:hypothetical protein
LQRHEQLDGVAKRLLRQVVELDQGPAAEVLHHQDLDFVEVLDRARQPGRLATLPERRVPQGEHVLERRLATACRVELGDRRHPGRRVQAHDEPIRSPCQELRPVEPVPARAQGLVDPDRQILHRA